MSPYNASLLRECRNDAHNGYADLWMRQDDVRTVPVYFHPATPVSAWRPKVEDFLRRLATLQPPNVLLQQITMLGEARDLLREAITPPTSTKGG